MAGWKETVMEEYSTDKFASEVMNGKIKDKGYVIKEGLIMRKNRIYLVSNSTIKKWIL